MDRDLQKIVCESIETVNSTLAEAPVTSYEIGPLRTVVIVTDAVEVCQAVLEPLVALPVARIPVSTLGTAERWLLEGEADLAVIDLSLGSDVVELVEEVRRTRSDVPILLLATAAQRQTAARLLGLGAFGYVMKPVFPDEVRAHVERALEWTTRRADRNGGEPLSPGARGRSA